MSKFKNSMGRRYLQGLFYEQTLEDKSSVVYTLKDEDHMGYPSLYKLYMQEDDPTEYYFAIRYLDGFEHWELLCDTSWFKPIVSRWRREMEIRLRARALLAIRATAQSDTRDAFTANKYLLDGNWKAVDEQKRGRPTKAQVTAAAHQQASEARRLDEDLNRITKGLQ